MVEKKNANKQVQKKEDPECDYIEGPSPNQYPLPPTIGYAHHDYSRWRNPAFTIQGRWFDGVPDSNGRTPGPIYDVGEFTRYGKMHVPGVIFPKVATRGTSGQTNSPGPAAYSFIDTKTSRGFTITGRRRGLKDKSYMPGPNQYKLPDAIGMDLVDLKSSPAFTIKSRPYIRKSHQLPGPTNYAIPDPSVYKTTAPRAIIPKKMAGKKMVLETPGPTQYQVNYTRVLPRAPCYTFGLRRNKCAGTFRTTVDNDL